MMDLKMFMYAHMHTHTCARTHTSHLNGNIKYKTFRNFA